jgi:UDP-N-acetylenolpyruvoylglucosamine reductase
MTTNQSLLKTLFLIRWFFNYSIAELTFFKIGGLAEIFYKAKDLDVLKQILVFCSKKNIPFNVVAV